VSRQKQTDSVLAGSLNVLPAGDQVPQSDALALHNWRVDQDGRLKVRRRHTLFLSGFDTPIVSIFRQKAATPRRYFAGGTKLYRDSAATVLSSACDGNPVGMVNYSGFAWIMNRGVQGCDKNSVAGALLRWVPAAPTVAPTPAIGAASANELSGTYTYYVSFDTDDGHEGNLSPESASVAPVNQQVNLTSIPVSSDPQVTKRHVYRAGGAQDQLYRVVTLLDNTTTTWTDDLNDTQAAYGSYAPNSGPLTHDADHYDPPAASVLAGPYYDRLLAANTSANPNWCFYTDQNKPYKWGFNSYFPVGEDGEAILAISVHPLYVLFYKEQSIWRLTGDVATGTLERLDVTAGIGGMRSWVSAGTSDYFRAEEGIFTCNGDQCSLVSGKLNPLFKGDAVPVAAYPQAITSDAGLMAFKNGRLYHCTGGQTFVFDADGGRWYTSSDNYTALCYDGQFGKFLGAVGGSIYALEDPAGAGALSVNYTTGYRNQGDPLTTKFYSDVTIEHALGGDTLTVTAYFNDGAFSRVLGKITSATRTPTTLSMADGEGNPVEARNCAISITGTANAQGEIYSLSVGYQTQRAFYLRAGETWQSAWLDFGTPRVKLAKQTAWTLDGSIQVTVETDEPAWNAQVSVANVDTTTNPQIRALPSNTHGQEYRVTILALADSRIYSGDLRVKTLGESESSTWSWAAIPIGE